MSWLISNNSGKQRPHIKEHKNEEGMVDLEAVYILQLRNECQQNLSFGYNYYSSPLSTQLNEFILLQTEMLFKLVFPTVLYVLKIGREDRKSPYCLHSLCTALVNSLIQRSRKESFKLKHYEAQEKV